MTSFSSRCVAVCVWVYAYVCWQTTCKCVCVCVYWGGVWERERERFYLFVSDMYRQHFSTLTWRERGGLECTTWLSTAPQSTRISIAAARLTHLSTTSQRAVSLYGCIWAPLTQLFLFWISLSLPPSLPPSPSPSLSPSLPLSPPPNVLKLPVQIRRPPIMYVALEIQTKL